VPSGLIAAARAEARAARQLHTVPRWLRGLPTASGLIAVALGVAVVIGWATGNRTLIQISPSLRAVTMNTAIALIALGVSMVLKARGHVPRVATTLSLAVAILMLATLVEWVFGVSLGIDQLLVRDHIDRTVPGRLSPYTAVGFSLIAGALITRDSRWPRLCVGCVFGAVSCTLLASIGFAYGASALRGAANVSGLAPPTLAAMFVLCAALAVLRPERLPLVTLLRRGTAGDFTRRLLPVAVLSPLALGGASLAGELEGLYDLRYEVALFAWAMVIVLSFFVLRTARAIGERETAQLGADAEIDAARSDIDAFFSLSLDAMIIANVDGYYLRVNPAFASMLGFTVDELLANPINELVHPEDAALSRERFASLVSGTDVAQRENRYRCKDGSYRWMLWTASGSDERGRIYASGKDVTHRHEMEERLRESEGQALEAARLKSEFVASMSHELRTPLNGVVGMTDLLRDTALDRRQRNYVDALALSSEALLAVISDVLDFSKMEAGHLDLDLTEFDLRNLVEEATLMLAAQAHGKGLEISHWVELELPEIVLGDRARLRQILLNLLSNAVKFTGAGEVALRVTRSGGDELRFAVDDTGIGIEEDKIAALFAAFSQADQSTTREYGGTGLGLAISRRLVELMGGAIGVEPRTSGGSRFWFSVALPAVAGPTTRARSRDDLRGRRILAVDDNATNRTILDHYLQSWGATSESHELPIAALDALAAAAHEGEPFELAVLDFNMPQMDGIALARAIRELPALRALPLVILSSGPIDPADCEGLEISSILSKPTRQAELYVALSDAIAGRNNSQPADAPTAAPAAKDRGLVVLVAEDNAINYTLADALLAKLGLRTELAHDGREAVAMAAARDYSAIFMDCQMPLLDGFAATRAIRAAEKGSRVPIVAMTALSLTGDRERCVAAGMNDYLSKPISIEALEAVVSRWLPASEAATTIGAPAPDAAGATDGAREDADGVLDLATVERIRGSLTSEKCDALVASFDEQQQACVTEIGAAISRGDGAEVRRVAHKLKGSSASLGARRLRAYCQDLELGENGYAVPGDAQLAQLRALAVEAGQALRSALTV
jgi:PAS domain S-box-containing protein